MEALKNINTEKILFLDIETAPQYPNYKDVPESFRKLWDGKANFLVKDKKTQADVYKNAGIYAEYGKVVCITVGMFSPTKSTDSEFHRSGKSCRLKSFYGDDEKIMLEEFSELLNKHYKTEAHYLCAHNGKEFDFPFLA